jgi:CHAT domain-containing protein
VRTSGTQLRRAIWDPVFSHVAGATTLFVVPDDALSLVPFAALPGKREEFVLEEAPVIHYLTAERDLLRVEEEPGEIAHSLLAVGGPAFDDASTLAARQIGEGEADPAVPALRAAPSHCDSFQSLQFTPLAGAVREVEDVARLWRGPGGALAARVLVSNEATERMFKQEAPRHQVIHLATHGFFLDATCPSTTAGLRAVGGLVSATGRKPQRLPEAVADSPLLLSGVALAGANRRASAVGGEEDGILTAEEVSGLDLSGVRWAVLSACNTGVGEVRAGEGVFGLRRAFQIAGARTVIMSLWSVDDEATRVWMHALYDGRLNRKLGTADAVREASVTVLRARRSAGQSTHPFYWAAFVAAGDWR